MSGNREIESSAPLGGGVETKNISPQEGLGNPSLGLEAKVSLSSTVSNEEVLNQILPKTQWHNWVNWPNSGVICSTKYLFGSYVSNKYLWVFQVFSDMMVISKFEHNLSYALPPSFKLINAYFFPRDSLEYRTVIDHLNKINFLSKEEKDYLLR
ncbi:MAG: hypothetical protein QXP04_02790 [Candidatus Nanoarchaeia archaeon]|nr:hypothetical protein [Candidatus Jingweiarchaeum tengchongense]